MMQFIGDVKQWMHALSMEWKLVLFTVGAFAATFLICLLISMVSDLRDEIQAEREADDRAYRELGHVPPEDDNTDWVRRVAWNEVLDYGSHSSGSVSTRTTSYVGRHQLAMT